MSVWGLAGKTVLVTRTVVFTLNLLAALIGAAILFWPAGPPAPFLPDSGFTSAPPAAGAAH